MKEAVTEILLFCAFAGALSCFFLFSEENGGIRSRFRFALGVLLVALSAEALSGLPGLIGDLSLSLSEFPEAAEAPFGDHPLGEEAFFLGIRRAVADRFSLAEEEISVSGEDFDFPKMRAKKLKILLTGKAARADLFAVRRYVTETFGDCEVEIGFA